MTYKKLITLLICFCFLGMILYKYFFYFDIKNGCFIKILPSFQGGNTKIKKSINVLKNASFEDYNNLCKHVQTIDPNLLGGGLYWDKLNSKTILVNASGYNLQIVAAIIVHETCHAMQHQQNKALNEGECYSKDDKFIKEITSF